MRSNQNNVKPENYVPIIQNQYQLHDYNQKFEESVQTFKYALVKNRRTLAWFEYTDLHNDR